MLSELSELLSLARDHLPMWAVVACAPAIVSWLLRNHVKSLRLSGRQVLVVASASWFFAVAVEHYRMLPGGRHLSLLCEWQMSTALRAVPQGHVTIAYRPQRESRMLKDRFRRLFTVSGWQVAEGIAPIPTAGTAFGIHMTYKSGGPNEGAVARALSGILSERCGLAVAQPRADQIADDLAIFVELDPDEEVHLEFVPR